MDDSVELANKAKNDGVEVDLVVWPRMWHDCPLPPSLPLSPTHTPRAPARAGYALGLKLAWLTLAMGYWRRGHVRGGSRYVRSQAWLC